MSVEFPKELLISIFLKLPLKSILICSSVCKTWYNLITSPYFITTHLNFHKNNTPQLLIRHYNSHRKEDYSLYHDNESFDFCNKFDFPFKAVNEFFRVIGSCNGLICLSDDYVNYTGKIILWNPFLKKSVHLPKPISKRFLNVNWKYSIGFGFDFATDDYKVVRIVHPHTGLAQNPKLHQIYPKIDLYRLSRRNWEDISHLALPCYIVESSVAGYVNGALHWIGWDKNRRHMVVLFNMQSDVFHELMLPYSLANHVSLWGDSLFDCQGSLCLVHNFRDEVGNRSFDIWLMKEYGVEESWMKCFVVNNSSLRRPLGFRNNGESVWVKKNGYLISYLPQNLQMKEIGIGGSKRLPSRFSFYVGTLTESLVLLDRRPDS